MDIRALLEKRANIFAQVREITEAAETESRYLTAEEEERVGKMLEEIDAIWKTVEREERLAGLETELEAPYRGREPIRPEPEGVPAERSSDPRDTEEYRTAFRHFVKDGSRSLTPEMVAEFRALQADVDISGGFLLAPLQFVRDLIKAVDDEVFIRQFATVMQVSGAQGLGAPSLDADPADADWTSELATGSEDSTMALGRRELFPKPLAKRIKVSRKLLRLSPDAEALVRARLAYVFGTTWEKAGMTGTGANQPLGVFTASSQGISTGRDVSDGNTTTSIEFDGLINAKYSVKGQYWTNARWMFHRDAMKQIAKLKDGEGQYLWRESVRVGEPDRVLGLPVHMSEYAPNTFTTGLYVGILGEFRHYWIADSLDFEVQRLEELYAETHQVGFIGRLESDGMPVLEEAFARVKLA